MVCRKLNVIKFVVNSIATKSVITQLGALTFGFKTGEIMYSCITPAVLGTYSCIGTYSFGTNNGITSTPGDIMTLQNNIQIINDYPALSASFPEIIYIYQKQ